ncbi:MAG: TlpA family protein disulfide reductase, partial [Planctomycetota bacterium]
GALDPESQAPMIREDLAALERMPDKDPAEWLYVQVFGRMSLGAEPAARAALLGLLEQHGDAFVTFLAHNDYEYQCFSQGITGEGPDHVAAATRAAMVRHPGSPLSRDRAIPAAREKTLPTDALEAIAAAWSEEHPGHPLPDYLLAQAYAHGDSDRDADRTIDHARRAVDGLLEGRLTFQEEMSGQVTRSYLRGAFRLWVEAAIRARHYGDAIAAAEAAISLQDQTDARFSNLLGRAWSDIGDFDRATAAYARAYQAGDDGAMSSLRDLYVARHEDEAGFDEFFAELTRHSDEDDARPAAADFEVTDLDGVEYRLAELKGKVVVLNFWFIGCAPCRVEIPGLNQLVESYAERDDVVFIAFAMDPADALREFLAEKPFDYAIVPSAGHLTQLFEARSYPTHLIIDREGRIAARLVGGSKDRHEDLRPLIERALAE